MKSGVRNFLLIFFSALLIFSAWKVYDIQRNYKIGQEVYADLTQYVSTPETPSDDEISGRDNWQEPTLQSEKLDVNWPKVDFEMLSQINPDIVGWIYIENTDINFPVVQTDNNNYYMKRLFDGTWNSSGSIFLDASASSDFSDRHSIIYGHNMKNGAMFASLMNYKDPAFYEEHPEILLLTPTCNYVIRIFSAHVASSDVNPWERDFDNISFEDWLSAITAQSVSISENQPQSKDTIISLSTCSYEFNDARFLVHGYIYYSEQTQADVLK